MPGSVLAPPGGPDGHSTCVGIRRSLLKTSTISGTPGTVAHLVVGHASAQDHGEVFLVLCLGDLGHLFQFLISQLWLFPSAFAFLAFLVPFALLQLCQLCPSPAAASRGFALWFPSFLALVQRVFLGPLSAVFAFHLAFHHRQVQLLHASYCSDF